MTVGAVAGIDPVTELLNDVAEISRKAAAMLGPDRVWAMSNADLMSVLHGAEAAASVVTGVQLAAVREIDARGVAAEAGQVSTAAWLGKRLALHPGEAKARVSNAAMLSTKASATRSALIEGRLNPDQARAIAKGLARIEPHADAETFAQAEEFLLTECAGLHSRAHRAGGRAPRGRPRPRR